jgi:hypothetical protein
MVVTKLGATVEDGLLSDASLLLEDPVGGTDAQLATTSASGTRQEMANFTATPR